MALRHFRDYVTDPSVCGGLSDWYVVCSVSHTLVKNPEKTLSILGQFANRVLIDRELNRAEIDEPRQGTLITGKHSQNNVATVTVESGQKRQMLVLLNSSIVVDFAVECSRLCCALAAAIVQVEQEEVAAKAKQDLHADLSKLNLSVPGDS